jgi:hypothetical protein
MRYPPFLTFRVLELTSFTASFVYAVLLVLAFALGNPQPLTFIFGMTHGILWIAMSLACLAAARARVIPFWLAVTVAVLGGLGPFMGSIGFIVEDRRRRRGARDPQAGLDGAEGGAGAQGPGVKVSGGT